MHPLAKRSEFALGPPQQLMQILSWLQSLEAGVGFACIASLDHTKHLVFYTRTRDTRISISYHIISYCSTTVVKSIGGEVRKKNSTRAQGKPSKPHGIFHCNLHHPTGIGIIYHGSAFHSHKFSCSSIVRVVSCNC